ncbi:MAG: DUF1648 domain-containing protein [Armatimonadaceae bacterium]
MFSVRNMGSVLLWAMVSVAAAHMAFYYPQLPERIASHFGPNGQADGWMSKDSFALFNLGMITFLVLIFQGVSVMMRKLPAEMINLPNKEYWLAPERRAETIARSSAQMSWFGIATCALFIAIMHLTFQANLDGSFRLPASALYFLFGYLIFTKIWVIQLLRSSSIPGGR